MIHSLIEFVEKVVLPLGAKGVFLAEFIEEVIVPIPSALILLGSGFVFLKGSLSVSLVSDLFLKVVLPATAGLTLGSLVIYYLAFRLEKFFIDKFGGLISVTEKDIEDLKVKLDNFKYDTIFLILARIFPVVPSVLIAVFCGVIKMDWKKYLYITVVGAFFRSLLLAIVGWQIGEFYVKFAEIIGKFENVIFGLIVISLAVFIGYRKYKKTVV